MCLLFWEYAQRKNVEKFFLQSLLMIIIQVLYTHKYISLMVYTNQIYQSWSIIIYAIKQTIFSYNEVWADEGNLFSNTFLYLENAN